MDRLSVVICEEDRTYGEKLTAWLAEQGKEEVMAYYFSEEEKLRIYYQKEPPDIILIGKSFAEIPWISEKITGEERKSLWIYLEEDAIQMEEKNGINIPVIEKNQPATAISRQIFREYECGRYKEHGISYRKTEIIGWYTPGGSGWQTPLALTMAAVLGRKEKVLYLNLKECAGFDGWFQEKYDLDIMDLIYMAVENEKNFMQKIKSLVYVMEGFDYVPPVLDSHLLGETSSREYEEFLRILETKAPYDVILLDMGFMLPGFFRILEKCSCIYVPAERDMLGEGPRNQFAEMIRRQNNPKLESKTVWLDLPEMNRELLRPGYLMQQWIWGEPGNYIRELLEGRLGRA